MQDRHIAKNSEQSAIRLWLADKNLRTPGGQVGLVVTAQDFLSRFNLTAQSFKYLCPLAKTPDEYFETQKSTGWEHWKYVAVDLYENNSLGLKPGFYLTPVEPAVAIQAYGRDTFTAQTAEKLKATDLYNELIKKSIKDAEDSET